MTQPSITPTLWRPSERIRRPSEIASGSRVPYPRVTDDDPRWKQLREPFPPHQVGHKPQPYCQACNRSQSKVCDRHTKKRCRVCGNNLTEAHIDLDYVGHAAVTQRLLEVDPHWEWRWITKPELEEGNFPSSGDNGRWLWLFVLDQVRPGLGEIEGSQLQGANALKALMSDGIKNASMRYGVAIETWSKEDLANERSIEAERKDEELAAQRAEEQAPMVEGWIKRVEACETQPELQKIYDAARTARLYTGELKTAILARKKAIAEAAAGVPQQPADPSAATS